MLEEFTVDNFKSLINVTFRPHEQNLLLGTNNAGKTNLCEALRFLSGTTRLPLSECAEQTAGGAAGLPNWTLDKPTVDLIAKAAVSYENEPVSFEYRLTMLCRSTTSGSVLDVQNELLYATWGGRDRALLLDNSPRGVRLLNETEFAEGRTAYAETAAPRDTTMLNRLYETGTNPRANCFRKYITSWQYYDLSLEALRGSKHLADWTVLNTNGDNLGSVIYQLKMENEREYRNLLRCLREFDPSIDVINFGVPTKDKVFMAFQSRNRHRLPAGNASGGTLRYLALLYVLFGQPQGGMTSLRIIEEPENGIYVGCLKPLLQLAGEADPPQQLIFTSHSPYFIDLFDNRLDSIFVMKRGEYHSSIRQPDPELVTRRLEKFPLGEQHFREMLG
ncbi:MAG: AAA family ATPase [Thermoguttaceae bacterium]|jgi:predicted ATPase